MSAQTKGEKVFRGIAVSAGICRGKILVLHRTRHVVSRREIPEAEIVEEVKRFEQVLVQTRKQIKEVQRRVTQSMSSSEGENFDIDNISGSESDGYAPVKKKSVSRV